MVIAPLENSSWRTSTSLPTRVISRPVLTTLTLTFGLDMILYNFMNLGFTATPRRVILDLGRLDLGGVILPLDRVAAMGLALTLTGLLAGTEYFYRIRSTTGEVAAMNARVNDGSHLASSPGSRSATTLSTMVATLRQIGCAR